MAVTVVTAVVFSATDIFAMAPPPFEVITGAVLSLWSFTKSLRSLATPSDEVVIVLLELTLDSLPGMISRKALPVLTVPPRTVVSTK